MLQNLCFQFDTGTLSYSVASICCRLFMLVKFLVYLNIVTDICTNTKFNYFCFRYFVSVYTLILHCIPYIK